LEAGDESAAGGLPAMKKGRPEAALFYFIWSITSWVE